MEKPNIALVAMGPPSSGKTSWLARRVHELVGRGWRVIVHDLSGDVALKHGASETRDPRELVRRLAEPGVVALSGRESALEAYELAVKLAAYVRGRGVGPGVGFWVDEGADEHFLGGGWRSEVNPLRRGLLLRRHYGVAWFVGTQRPTEVNPAVYLQATEVAILPGTDEPALELLERKGMPAALAEAARRAPKYRAQVWRRGEVAPRPAQLSLRE